MRKKIMKQMKPMKKRKRMKQLDGIKKITAILLSCSLVMAGCAVNPAHTPANGQTGTASTVSAGRETDTETAAKTASETAAENAADAATAASVTVPPAGREGLRDFPEEEESAESSAASEDSRSLAPVNQTQKAENARITLTGEELPAASADYTVMIYMVGSNLETEREAATNDLEEILASGVDFQKNNVVVYTGGARKWAANVPCDRNCLLDLSKGSDRWLVGMTDGSSDMGSPETLTEFLQVTAANYPAEHYSLIFWDHGSGPIHGFGVDELFGLDSLQFDEMRKAMDASPFGPDGSARLDWVGFDACLMGSLENAGLWKDYTDYLVASEELEPAGGWDYSFLQTLNTTADPVKITGAIADSYYEWYTEKTSNNVTLSVCDLSKTGEAIEAYTDLAKKMDTDIQEGSYARIVQIRQKALTFGTSEAAGRGGGTDLVDLDDMAACFAEQYGPETEAVRKAVSDMVLINRSNMEGAAGLSVYFPGENQELYAQAESLFEDSVSVSDEVKAMYDSYTDRWEQASSADWTLADFRESGDEILLDLTPEQAANLAGAAYTVLYPVGNGQYYITMERVQAEVDSSGVVHIPADPELIAMQDLDGTFSPLGFIQASDKNGRQTYRSFQVALSPTDDYWFVEYTGVDQDAAIIAALEEGQITVQSVEAEDSTSAGKNTLDMRDYYRVVYDYGIACFPTRNEDGSMRSFEDWQGEGTVTGEKNFRLPEDKSIRLELRRVSDFYTEEPMILQLELSDVNGKNHPSEIYSLDANAQTSEEGIVIKEDEQGTWTYMLREDSAVLLKYEGGAEVLTIPAEADGLPVTEIAIDAIKFYEYDAVTEVILPETLKVLQRGAIQVCNMTSVSLPAGIEQVSPHAFANCYNLEQILIAGDPNGQSGEVRAIDGVLFNTEGTELLCYPLHHGTSYEVPEGTETIAYGAFAVDDFCENMILEAVTFPETVTAIEPLAFFGCYSLSEIRLPESLEYIGPRAFGLNQDYLNRLFYTGKNVPVESVYIGGNVEYIGKNAFDGLNLRRFLVSGSNRHYSAVGGMLAVKSGDTILEVPRGMDGLVYIPEGVVGIEEYLFSMLFTGTEFYLPDSLTRIPKSAFPYDFAKDDHGDYVKKYDALIHCSEESAAARFADKYGISRDTRQADDSLATALAYTTVTSPAPNGQFVFHVYEDHAVLVAFNGSAAAIEIPASAGGQPVTEIGDGRNSIENFHKSVYNDYTSEASGSGPAVQGGRTVFIKSLQLPDTVTRINARALDIIYMQLETLDLPSSLQYFDPEAIGLVYSPVPLEYDPKAVGWAYKAEIGAFRIRDCSAYKTVNGILYTADGKTLVSFPPAYDAGKLEAAGTAENGDTIYRLEIPAGTEYISPSAFAGYRAPNGTLQIQWPESLREIGAHAFTFSDIYDIRLPEGMETIGDEAFSMTRVRSEELILPDSITEIGVDAFGSIHREIDAAGTDLYGFRTIHIPADLKRMGNFAFSVLVEGEVTALECDNISLGSKLIHIGTGAFTGQNSMAFEVSPRNKTYSAADGFLLTADGKTLITAPSGMTGEVTIPKGVTGIQQFAMRECPYITDVHISSEVTMIGADVFAQDLDSYEDNAWKVTIHCPKGSAAADYADLLGIPWVEEN